MNRLFELQVCAFLGLLSLKNPDFSTLHGCKTSKYWSRVWARLMISPFYFGITVWKPYYQLIVLSPFDFRHLRYHHPAPCLIKERYWDNSKVLTSHLGFVPGIWLRFLDTAENDVYNPSNIMSNLICLDKVENELKISFAMQTES